MVLVRTSRITKPLMKKLNFTLALLTCALLAACGGGGAGSAAPNSLGGLAATGAPLSGAQVTLTCANGTTKLTTADASGQYAFSDLTGCSAPYVVTASGNVNGANESFVSIHPTAAVGAQNLNVTPISNAIAATLSSNGDPLNLAKNIASEAANISASAISQRTAALSAALSGMLLNAGLTTGFDLLTGTFSANKQGFDKILDNLSVDVKSSGIDITNTGSVVHDDLGNLSSAPVSDFSSGTITINKNTNFSSGLSALPAQILDSTFADSFQSVLNNCFAANAANRGNATSLGASCQTLQIAADYKNDGRTAANEFNGRLQSSLYDGAVFSKPIIVRYLSTSPNDTRAIVDFNLLRSDNVPETITTVVEQSTATGGALKLRGNQRPFYIDVSGVVQKRQQTAQRNATTAKLSTFYLTSIQFYLDYNIGGAGSNNANAVKYMHVTGPLLPTTGTGGVWLRKGPTGCDQYFTVWRDPSGNGAAPTATAPSNCSALWQLSSRAATPSDFDNYASLFGTDLTNNPHFADAKLADADILNIKPGSSYKFEVFLNSNAGTTTPDYVFYQRLRSRPYTMGDVNLGNGEIDMVRWTDGLLQSSSDAITPPASTNGLPNTVNSLNVSYIRTKDAPAPFKVMVQVKQLNAGTYSTQVDSAMLPISPNYVDGSVISRDLNNSGTPWNNPQKTAGANTLNFIQLVAKNKMGTMVLRDWKY